MTGVSDGNRQTHFGYRTVAESEKADLVGAVFSSVADRYDVMNDAMSLGVHRLWKRFAVGCCALSAGQRVLDVAGGSGDLSLQFASQVGADGRVVLTDINPDMLARGRARLIDRGVIDNVEFAIADAEDLPFEAGSFDCVSISFGLRNVTRKDKALASMYRVLKPGGRLVVLEFSKPVLPLLEKAYDAWSFSVIPRLGQAIAGDEDSYRYLVESIRRHPDQDTLAGMMGDAGFEDVRVHNLSGGIVAVHIGFKY